VYNCPEILTNSSSVFQGVELSLYPLLEALQKDASNKETAEVILNECKALLKDDFDFAHIKKTLDAYLQNEITVEHCKYETWPLNSNKAQMEYMIQSSDYVIGLHKDEKKLITFILSEVVFKSCGYVMLHDSWMPKAPVAWIGHDLVASCI
jgi:hypothetical protein